MNLLTKIPVNIRKTVALYFYILCFYTIFRIILFITELYRINALTSVKDIVKAFIMGVRFDIVISGYILLLPYITLTIYSLIKPRINKIKTVVFFYILIFFSLSLTLCAIDVPFFNQFFSRLSVTALEWINSPVFIFKMVFQEPKYWIITIPLILCVFVFYKILKRIFNESFENNHTKTSVHIIRSVIFLFFILVGIRGRVEEKSPIRVGTAYFSNNAFLNQLGLNPNFTFIRSYLDSKKERNKRIQLIDEKIAITNVQKYLHIDSIDNNFPILREENISGNKKNNYNVVVVMMESMSAAKMKRHGNKNNLTNFLDSISNEGCYFENTYSAGIHTFNGIFGTLFSMPALFRQNPMKESSIVQYHGLFNTLRKNGYSTIYFTTHDGQFDNVDGFLHANDCERVVSKADYPSDKVKTTLGVPDDYMFEFSIPVLNNLGKKGKPFVAAFMTASDHGPFYIPDYFKPKNKEMKNRIVEYADYSLHKFVNLASKQSWFKNTIFVFIADHGAPMDVTYDMSLDYNHAPLIFYAPEILKSHKTYSEMAGQIDVFPSIMGLLKIPYKNNTLGINLFEEKRPYIFFNADDKYGVIDTDLYLIVRNDNSRSLYKYRDKNTKNFILEMPDKAKEMELYAKSNLQTCQYLYMTHKQ